FLGAVGVDLDEDPFRPTLDVDAGLDPGVDTLARGWRHRADVGVLYPRQHAPLPVLPAEAQRTLHDHQVALLGATDLHPRPGVVGFRAHRIVLGVVDPVHRTRLARVGRRR